jgi:hypothetical protein
MISKLVRLTLFGLSSVVLGTILWAQPCLLLLARIGKLGNISRTAQFHILLEQNHQGVPMFEGLFQPMHCCSFSGLPCWYSDPRNCRR